MSVSNARAMPGIPPQRKDESERLSLATAATHLLEECRMVLPGIQALFGFQFVAVFNSGFTERLSPLEREAHLVALMCVLVAAALVVAPAAIHRLAQPRSISARFLRMSSALLMGSMAPLAVGTTIDVVLVAHVITGSRFASLGIGAVAFAMFVFAWVLLPAFAKRDFGTRVTTEPLLRGEAHASNGEASRTRGQKE